jgi:hypothetical protein
MAHYFIAYREVLVFQAEPFAAIGAMHGFSPVEKRGQDDDEEEYRAYGGEDFRVVYEGEEFGAGQEGLLLTRCEMATAIFFHCFLRSDRMRLPGLPIKIRTDVYLIPPKPSSFLIQASK